MKILLKHIFRNIKEHKIRSLLIFMSLLISTTVLTISITIPDDLTIKVEDTMRSVYGKAEVEVTTLEPFKLEDLKTKDSAYKVITTTSVEGLNKKEKPVALRGLDLKKANDFNLLKTDILNLKDNEVLISEKQAIKNHYKKNDEIIFKYNGIEKTFIIKDIIAKKGLASIDEKGEVFYTTRENVNKIRNIANDLVDSVYFDVKDNKKINSFVEYLKDNNKNYIINKTVDIEAIKDSTTMVSTLMFIISLMSTIMIYFVISSLNKIILAERIPVIGTFRSIGASKNKMNYILILENAVYGIFAGILGSLLGMYLDGICSNAFIYVEGVELSKASIKISPIILLIGIIFSTTIQILITIKEILRTNKKPIKTLIFNTQNTRYRLRKKRTVIGFILLILALLIYKLNIEENLLFMSITLIIFMVAISNIIPLIIQVLAKLLSKVCKKLNMQTALVASKNMGYNKMIIASSRLVIIAISLLSSIILMSNSINKVFNNFRDVTQGIDIIVENTSKQSDEYKKLEILKEIKKVKPIYAIFVEDATYNKGKKFSNPPGIYAEDERNSNYIKEKDYKIKKLKNNEILIDEKYAAKNKLKKGNKLTIDYGGLNKKYTYKIVGFVDSSNFSVSRNIMVVSLNHFINDLDGNVMQLHIVCRKNTNNKKVKKIVKDNIKEVNIIVKTTEEYIKDQEEEVGAITSIVYVVIGISVLLAFVGIINNQIISFIQRQKELAILNSTCMSKKQIMKMLALETIIANLVSIILAIIISYITTTLINNFMNIIQIYLNIKFDLYEVSKFAGIIYLVLILTLLVPFIKIRKMNIVDEIKYE